MIRWAPGLPCDSFQDRTNVGVPANPQPGAERDETGRRRAERRVRRLQRPPEDAELGPQCLTHVGRVHPQDREKETCDQRWEDLQQEDREKKTREQNRAGYFKSAAQKGANSKIAHEAGGQ